MDSFIVFKGGETQYMQTGHVVVHELQLRSQEGRSKEI